MNTITRSKIERQLREARRLVFSDDKTISTLASATIKACQDLLRPDWEEERRVREEGKLDRWFAIQ